MLVKLTIVIALFIHLVQFESTLANAEPDRGLTKKGYRVCREAIRALNIISGARAAWATVGVFLSPTPLQRTPEKKEKKMRMKVLCLAIALLGTAGFASTVTAGAVNCAGGGCKSGKVASTNKATPAQASERQDAHRPPTFYHPPLIAPIWTTPEGQTYGRWAAEWWKWVLGVPTKSGVVPGDPGRNPNFDMTGAFCGERQVGKVWFLASTFLAGPPIVRTCKIPAGKSLFVPLINRGYFGFLDDPPEQRTEAFAREQARCTEPATISVKIDGFPVSKPEKYFTGPSGSESPIFNVQMPPVPPGNVLQLFGFTVLEQTLTPSAEQGYYLFVWPLKPGRRHTIKWQASGCSPGANLDITYQLDVGK
jgi:hypothetical protein